MAKPTILLIEDDPKTEASIREALGKEYALEAAPSTASAAAFLVNKTPDLIIIDFDLKGEDGMQVFRSLGSSVKTVMLSASGSIPLAVSAAKSGITEFLGKPVNADLLKGAVERNILKAEAKLRWVKGLEWLRGESPKLKEIQKSLRENMDIILVGEQGAPKEEIAEFIHSNSPKKERKLVKIDLNSFRTETLEPHFWANIHELLAIPSPASLQNEEDRCGTLYLENVDGLSDQFKLSIFNFFRERPAKIDKGIRVIFGGYDKISIHGYAYVEIPPLRERKEDIPYLLGSYLARFSSEYNKNVGFISSEVLNFLTAYDYPGNYAELENLMRSAVLRATSERLEIKDLPFNLKRLLLTSLKEGLKEGLTLEEAKRRFEKGLYDVLLKKSEEEKSSVARFLDFPKTALTERIEDLLD
jgi:two-component system response regulator HydG